MNSTRVLALLPLFLGLAHSFSWDIVVGEEQELQFYHNGTLTHTEVIPSGFFITSVTYDPVHYRVLFAVFDPNNSTISSFDLSTRQIQPIVTREADNNMRVVYDPVTQLLIWTEKSKIYSLSLKPALSNEAVDGNLLFTDHFCYDLAVDSCGGYIYWSTDDEIGRARFDGSERTVLIQGTGHERQSLAIDQRTQKMFWIEKNKINDGIQLSIESADFNGNNRRTLYTDKNESGANSLAVSKDFIYWWSYFQMKIWQLPKNPQNNEEPKLFLNFHRYFLNCQGIVANYTLMEQTQGIEKCEALKSLTQDNSEPKRTEESLLCVHGTEVSGGSRCECAQGYTGERCDVSLCHNYCLHGDCRVGAEGQPKCSCKVGYSGKRCEVNACYIYCLNNGVCSFNEENEPVCQCTAAYEGERCDVSICKDYCLQGNCSVDTEGRPKCRCNSGYSGERCEVNPCAEYCLNDGACSLNAEHQPVCRCTAGYEGARCDVSVCKDLSFQAACSVSAEGQPKVTVTLGRAVVSTCAASVG